MRVYPLAAGSKEAQTSLFAAQAVESSGRAAILRTKVRAFFESGGEATADEVAGMLGQSILSIRPRLSELRALGLIEPSGKRRGMDGGRPGHVWRLK